MIDPDDAVRIIAEATASIDASTLRMAANLEALRQDARLMRSDARLMRWLLGCAVLMIGLSLIGLGVLTWHTIAHRGESAALMRAVLTNTQTIDAQTRALLEERRLR